MLSKTHDTFCNCERIMQIGSWEDIDKLSGSVSGPWVQCENCGMQFALTWEQWEKVPIENKAVVRAH